MIKLNHSSHLLFVLIAFIAFLAFLTFTAAPLAAQSKRFITMWDTRLGDGNKTIKIKTYSPNVTISYTVKNRNGRIIRNKVSHKGNISLNFSSHDVYTIEIQASEYHLHFDENGPSAKKLISVTNWGTVKWANTDAMFRNCSNLTSIPTSAPDLSIAQSLNYMFDGASKFNSDISNWDVSNVRSMQGMFQHATSFNRPLNKWDVSNVTNMKSVFEHATSFNQPLNSWDVSNVTDMRAMFYGAEKFNKPLNNWDVSNVTNMRAMFLVATEFNQPLNNWNVSKVTNMRSMFNRAKKFIHPLNNWDVSSVENMRLMFFIAEKFNQPLDSWDVSNVKNMYGMFYRAKKFNKPLNRWKVSKVTNMQLMFSDATEFNQPLDSWDVSNVKNMYGMFSDATEFNQPLDSWDVSNVKNMTNMLTNSGMNTRNYDATLKEWSKKTLQKNVTLSGGPHYCESDMERQKIITDYEWTITDKGKKCNTPKIEVFEGTDNNGTKLSSTSTAQFGTNRTHNTESITKQFVVYNNGGAALSIAKITLPANYSTTLPSTFTLPTNEKRAFTISLSRKNAGKQKGTVTIESNSEGGDLVFNVEGNITSPDIVVYEGKKQNDKIIVSNSTIFLGSTPILENITKTFGIFNPTLSDINNVEVKSDNPLFEVKNAPSTIPSLQSRNFDVVLIATKRGTHSVNITTSSDIFSHTFVINGVVTFDKPILVYNVVTPNGDNVHDYLKINNIQFYPSNKVTIFNRWGVVVYEMEKYDNDNERKRFDGTANKSGIDLITGNYYYAIDLGDGSKIITGFLYLKK